MKLARILMVSVIVSMMAGMALAQPGGGGFGAGGGRGMGRGGRGGAVTTLTSTASQITVMFNAVEKMSLTEDQKSKIAGLKKYYQPKDKDFTDKMAGVLTTDQKKALDEGKTKVNAAEGADRFQAITDLTTALALTDDENTKLNDFSTRLTALDTLARGDIRDVLTPDQQAQFDQAVPQRGGRGVGGPGRGRNGRGVQST